MTGFAGGIDKKIELLKLEGSYIHEDKEKGRFVGNVALVVPSSLIYP